MKLTVSSEIEKTKEEIVILQRWFDEDIEKARASNDLCAPLQRLNHHLHDRILRLKIYLVALGIYKRLPDLDIFAEILLIDLPEKTSE